jgi:hypothetical protein
MISDDELRARLTQIDPLPTSIPVDSFTSPKAQDILERVMTTQIHDKDQKHPGQRWRKPALLTGVAAAVIAFGIVLVGVTSEGPNIPSKAKTTLALQVANGGVTAGSAKTAGSANAAASCVVFNVSFLREMPLAFAGTVTSITITTLGNMTVTLSIDHWYKGGSADVVTLTTMTAHALTPTTWVDVEDGVDFIQGKRYLVTATNGTVNGCGFTGESTPILEKAFAEAFPRS